MRGISGVNIGNALSRTNSHSTTSGIIDTDIRSILCTHFEADDDLYHALTVGTDSEIRTASISESMPKGFLGFCTTPLVLRTRSLVEEFLFEELNSCTAPAHIIARLNPGSAGSIANDLMVSGAPITVPCITGVSQQERLSMVRARRRVAGVLNVAARLMRENERNVHLFAEISLLEQVLSVMREHVDSQRVALQWLRLVRYICQPAVSFDASKAELTTSEAMYSLNSLGITDMVLVLLRLHGYGGLGYVCEEIDSNMEEARNESKEEKSIKEESKMEWREKEESQEKQQQDEDPLAAEGISPLPPITSLQQFLKTTADKRLSISALNSAASDSAKDIRTALAISRFGFTILAFFAAGDSEEVVKRLTDNALPLYALSILQYFVRDLRENKKHWFGSEGVNNHGLRPGLFEAVPLLEVLGLLIGNLLKKHSVKSLLGSLGACEALIIGSFHFLNV